MTGEDEYGDRGFAIAVQPPAPPDLAALQQRLSRAIDTVNDLAKAHADTIRDMVSAKRRAKVWADLAYEMWALLQNSEAVEGQDDWERTKDALRVRLNAALTEMPEDV